MVTYKSRPVVKAVVGGVTFERDDLLRGNVIRVENGFDTCTLDFNDYKSKNYPGNITAGDTVIVYFKDWSDAAWIEVFDGVVRFLDLLLPSETLRLKCDGAGRGFTETVCAEEYGVQSSNPTLDTIKEILEDAGNGIVDKWVEKLLGTATNTGFTYTTEVETIAGVIQYLYFPYKPCDKCLNDIVDIVQAIKGSNAGPHWIVTGSNVLMVSTVGNHHAAAAAAGWSTYYGGSQAASTLVQGTDFTRYKFQKLTKEANYILYHGAWRRPRLDIWTENSAALWGCTGGACTVTDSNTSIVGSKSIDCTGTTGGTTSFFYYPSARNLGLDFTKFGGDFSPAELHMYLRLDYVAGLPSLLEVHMWTSAGNQFTYSLKTELDTGGTGVFKHFILPLGSNFSNDRYGDFSGWTNSAAASWSNINAFQIAFTPFGAGVSSTSVLVDGLQFVGHVLRGARQSGAYSSNDPVKMKLITDNIAKDDSGKAADDSGTIARLAAAELLRCKTTPTVGFVVTPLIKDLWPGMLLHLHAKPDGGGTFKVNSDFRVVKLIHYFGVEGYLTQSFVTSDVVNSRARAGFDDYNKMMADVRPEFQDRQATSLKTRDIDITLPILEKSY